MTTTNAQTAVKAALSIYAESLGVSFAEAIELFKSNQSTRECIELLVLVQADAKGLKKMVATL